MRKAFVGNDWDLAEPNGSIGTWEKAGIAVLMDIRDEMRRMNSVLHCQNFLCVPQTLRDIKRNTTKPRRRKAVLRRSPIGSRPTW
jgi:hypothetical protein